jgi:hypothetical protein
MMMRIVMNIITLMSCAIIRGIMFASTIMSTSSIMSSVWDNIGF